MSIFLLLCSHYMIPRTPQPTHPSSYLALPGLSTCPAWSPGPGTGPASTPPHQRPQNNPRRSLALERDRYLSQEVVYLPQVLSASEIQPYFANIIGKMCLGVRDDKSFTQNVRTSHTEFTMVSIHVF